MVACQKALGLCLSFCRCYCACGWENGCSGVGCFQSTSTENSSLKLSSLDLYLKNGPTASSGTIHPFVCTYFRFIGSSHRMVPVLSREAAGRHLQLVFSIWRFFNIAKIGSEQKIMWTRYKIVADSPFWELFIFKWVDQYRYLVRTITALLGPFSHGNTKTKTLFHCLLELCLAHLLVSLSLGGLSDPAAPDDLPPRHRLRVAQETPAIVSKWSCFLFLRGGNS